MQSAMLLTLAAMLVLGNSARLQFTRHNWLFADSSGSKHNTYSLRSNNEESNTKRHQEQYVVHKDNKKAAISTKELKNIDKDDEENKVERKVTYNNNGVRKQQWHNYPRRLDRLERFKRDIDNIEVDKAEESRKYNEIPVYNKKLEDSSDLSSFGSLEDANDELESFDSIERLNPILILRIRISFLCWKNLSGQKNKRFEPVEQLNDVEDTPKTYEIEKIVENVPVYPIFGPLKTFPPWKVDPETKTIFITRGRLPTLQTTSDYPADFPDRRRRGAQQMRDEDEPPRVSKRIFSFWSRLQGMAHSGRELEHRRHFHSYGAFAPLDSHGDIVSAETRGLVRPPGSPLRWG